MNKESKRTVWVHTESGLSFYACLPKESASHFIYSEFTVGGPGTDGSLHKKRWGMFEFQNVFVFKEKKTLINHFFTSSMHTCTDVLRSDQVALMPCWNGSSCTATRWQCRVDQGWLGCGHRAHYQHWWGCISWEKKTQTVACSHLRTYCHLQYLTYRISALFLNLAVKSPEGIINSISPLPQYKLQRPTIWQNSFYGL